MHVKWEPPDDRIFKLNIDGAVVGGIGRGGLVGVVRDNRGQWILGFVQPIMHTIVVEVELRALLRGFQVAKNHNFKSLEINTDSLEVVNLLSKGNHKYDNIICECRYLMSLLKPVELRHMFRK